MSLLNSIVTVVCGSLLRLLQLVPPMVGLGLVSLATAIVMLLVIKATSNQRRIKAAQAGMYAAVLEMRLFNDDLGAVLRAQWALVKSNGAYVRAQFVPILWLIVPLGLLVVQLDHYFGFAPVTPGQPVLVTALLRADSDASLGPAATLASPPDVKTAIPGIWFPAAHEVVWRLSPAAPGEYGLHVRVGSEEFVKTLQVSELVVPSSLARVRPGFFEQLRHPLERPLPGRSPIQAIMVAYPERDLDVFGRHVHWMVIYGVLSILFALSLKRAFGVTL